MARHRNVRSMNYADEYDGYDDVYGHSVEDDYSISPSDASYVFDRNQKAQMSAFLAGDEDIAEEDEDIEEGNESSKRRDSETLGLQNRNLSELDEARLRSCLDEIRNVIGDSLSEASLADIILANEFDVAKSLDSALSNAADESRKPPTKIKKQDSTLPQRDVRGCSDTDDNSVDLSSLKEGISSLHLDEEESFKFSLTSYKPMFKIPILNRHSNDPEKKNILPCDKNTSNISSSELLENFSNESIKDLPGLKSFNIPSLSSKTNKIPPLSLKKLPISSGNKDDVNVDSDEEFSSLSALMAQHASKVSGPEHSSLSALAELHLISNKNLDAPNSKFVVPNLMKQQNSCPNSCASSAEETMPETIDEDNYGGDDNSFGAGESSFVIDLLCALNPPDIRKQLERPRSRLNADDLGGLMNDSVSHEDARPWLQDGTCVLDAKSVLSTDFPMELKLSSPLGRILCRRRYIRKSPYIRPSSPYFGGIIPFAFDTPSPDTIVQKHFWRQ